MRVHDHFPRDISRSTARLIGQVAFYGLPFPMR